jgi:hypothetical protein
LIAFDLILSVSVLRWEERRLFPSLSARYWFEKEDDTLAAQHTLLDQKLNQVTEMLKTLPEEPDDEIRLLLITAIEADEILLHHLGTPRLSLTLLTRSRSAYEEDLVIPILLSLSSEEFSSLSSRL